MSRIIFSLFIFIISSSVVDAQIDFSKNGDKVFTCKFPLENKNFNANHIYENVNIIYARCNWIIDPAKDSIKGSINYLFNPGNSIDSLTFDCSNALLIDSILFHQVSVLYSFDSSRLVIKFPVTLLGQTTDSVCIFYHGQPVSTGNGSFEQGYHSGAPIIWTLSEPYGASDWWPCRQNVADKIDSMDIYCEIPFGNKCASNGVLVSVDSTGNDLIYHWKTNYPIAPYLVALGVTNYVEFSDYVVLGNLDTLPILNYVYPEQLALLQSAISVTKSLIEFYDSLLIDYPFYKEKYGHAQFGWGGGMEHQTMSFIGSFAFELISHELSHQWFGDYKTCASWADIWLHEGFATYMAGMTIERFHPENWYIWKINALDDIISKSDGSVLCSDTSEVSRIFNGRLSYRKAAFVLHMLRWKYGDFLFSQALKNYLLSPNGAFGYNRTDDLKLAFENVTGENQDQFFNEWFYGEGFPSFKVEWSNKKNTVDLQLFQTTSNQSVSFYHIPVPIEFKNSQNDTTIVFNSNSSGQQFHFDLNFTPEFVNIDPEVRIISGRNSVIKILPDGSITDRILIFPNPSNGTFYLKSIDSFNSIIGFKLIDLLGKEVFSENFKVGSTNKNMEVTVASGIYLGELMTENGRFYQKIIIEK